MTYSYNLATNIGKLRLRVQDNDEDNVIFQDEELQVFLDDGFNNILQSAVGVYYALASKYSASSVSGSSFQIGTLKLSDDSALANKYLELAKMLEAQIIDGGSQAPIPYIYTGGIYVADKELQENDDTLIKNKFTMDQFDHDYLVNSNGDEDSL